MNRRRRFKAKRRRAHRKLVRQFMIEMELQHEYEFAEQFAYVVDAINESSRMQIDKMKAQSA